MIETVPNCQGTAHFDDEKQAEYVAEQLKLEFGTEWKVFPHDGHFHVLETEPL